MTDFITHIVVHDASEQDSAMVDQAMKNCHFADRIRSKYGATHQLPPGYFSQSHNMSAADVRNLALMASRVAGRRTDIITVAGDISYFLPPAAQAAAATAEPRGAGVLTPNAPR